MTAAGSRLLTRSAIACASLAVALVAAPTASAANPDCGEEITKDVKLTKNLNCSSASCSLDAVALAVRRSNTALSASDGA